VSEATTPSTTLVVDSRRSTSDNNGSMFYTKSGKRVLDLALGVPLLLLALPLILLLGIATVLASGWPPFYSAKRVGLAGREFSMWKIRTMAKNADEVLSGWGSSDVELAAQYAENFKLLDDPRVTSLGHFLRRTSMDELPQLWNVVKGEMSLVGPRPYYMHEIEGSPSTLAAVISIRPGLTGPWQTRGRSSLQPNSRFELDEAYATQLCLLGDLRYLIGTIRPLITANGV